jgi:hypothetical protein
MLEDFLAKICHSCLMPQRAVEILPDLLKDFLVKNLSLLPNAGEPNERHDCLVIKLHPGQVLKNNQKIALGGKPSLSAQ